MTALLPLPFGANGILLRPGAGTAADLTGSVRGCQTRVAHELPHSRYHPWTANHE